MGIPDKVCDLVAMELCKANSGGRNAIECMWGNKLFVVSGETNMRWKDEMLTSFVKKILSDVIGLTKEEVDSITVVNNLNIQSAEIDKIVGKSGTGDNGIYFGGYHSVYSPVIDHMKKMCETLTAPVLKDIGYRSDGKFIFTVDETGKILTLVMNCASFEGEPNEEAFENLIRAFTGVETEISINPRGNWKKCFGFADCGVTGRKLACDSSCGLFSHGGGAMLIKDISKADVTVPLYLNYLAKKHIGNSKVCEFSASSVIGDTVIDVYKDGKYFDSVEFDVMKEYVSSKELNVFGVLK